MGVVVRRYTDILTIIIFPYSTCISSFLGSSIPISLFILKMFFLSFEHEASQNGYTIQSSSSVHRDILYIKISEGPKLPRLCVCLCVRTRMCAIMHVHV